MTLKEKNKKMTPIDKNKKSIAWPLSQQSARLRQQNLGFRTRKGERDLFYHEKKSVPSREEDRIITRGKSYAHEGKPNNDEGIERTLRQRRLKTGRGA